MCSVGVGCVWVYLGVSGWICEDMNAVSADTRRGCWIPGAGVAGGCELFHVDGMAAETLNQESVQ